VISLVADVDATHGNCPLCGHEEDEGTSDENEENNEDHLPSGSNFYHFFMEIDEELNRIPTTNFLSTTNSAPNSTPSITTFRPSSVATTYSACYNRNIRKVEAVVHNQ
jgi:hypothetical protein